MRCYRKLLLVSITRRRVGRGVDRMVVLKVRKASADILISLQYCLLSPYFPVTEAAYPEGL